MVCVVRCTLLLCCSVILEYFENNYFSFFIYILIELLDYDGSCYELYCLPRRSSHCHTQSFTWLVLLLVKMSVGYGKVASGSAILHGTSILKAFQEVEYYMQQWVTSGLCSLWDPVTESGRFCRMLLSLSPDRWNQFRFLQPLSTLREPHYSLLASQVTHLFFRPKVLRRERSTYAALRSLSSSDLTVKLNRQLKWHNFHCHWQHKVHKKSPTNLWIRWRVIKKKTYREMG
jgi:hypothetical protein